MSLDKNDVQKIVQLAKLELGEQETAAYVETLSRILELVEQMNAVDTDQVAPMAHPQEAPLRLNEDVVTATNRREELQRIAPQTDAGLYLVPKVIE